jgi:uncharacterized protein (DUF433 family)
VPISIPKCFTQKSRRTADDPIDYKNLITRDPEILGGQPVLKGTRVMLNTVLSSLAEGATVEEILSDFPTLTEEHVRAAIAIAAEDEDPDAAQLRREMAIGEDFRRRIPVSERSSHRPEHPSRSPRSL